MWSSDVYIFPEWHEGREQGHPWQCGHDQEGVCTEISLSAIECAVQFYHLSDIACSAGSGNDIFTSASDGTHDKCNPINPLASDPDDRRRNDPVGA